MKQKILTISIAAYNVEKYLKTALNSLLVDSETLEKMEILIIDDGSTDTTSIIAEEYAEKYESIKVIHKKNGGYGSTINTSINIANGKYFKQLDGDDWYQKENLKDYIHYLENNEADIVLSQYARIQDDTGEILKTIGFHDYSQVQLFALEKFEPKQFRQIHMHEMAIKTEILKDNYITISERYMFTDNEYVVLPLIHAKTVSFFNRVIYNYRVSLDGQSVSVSGRKKHYEDAGVVFDKLIKEVTKSINVIPKEIQIGIKQILISLAEYQVFNLLLLEDKKHAVIQIKKFDESVKVADKTVYQGMNEIFKIRMLRFSRYLLFGLVRNYYIGELEKVR